jgi:hypothetical protein
MQEHSFIVEVVDLTNQYRIENGLSPLSIDLNLEKAAQQHSQNMANLDFFDHTGADGSLPWERAVEAGYESSYVGENIAAGYQTPKEVVDGWINSPGHRANILTADFNEIGIGYYQIDNDPGNVNFGSYWTQLLGKGEIESQNPPPNPPDHDLNDNPLNTRFYRYENKAISETYLFAGEGERPNVFANGGFIDQGYVFTLGSDPADGLISFTRFRLSDKVGTYFYAAEPEASSITPETNPNFIREGIAFYAYPGEANQATDIYRLRSLAVPGTYMYAPWEEAQQIASNSNFLIEGVAFEGIM